MSLSPKEIMEQTRDEVPGIFSTTLDPVAEEIRVPASEKIFLRGFPVIPFMGSGDATLKLLRKLARLSPTNASCIRSISHFVMGGGFDIIAKKRQAFARRSEQEIAVTEQEFHGYIDWLEDSAAQELVNIYDHQKRHFLNLIKYGNAYLEVVIWGQGSTAQFSVYNHDADRCLYLATEPGEPEVILISPYWYQTTGSEEEVDAVPVFPNFTVDEDGKFRTMIHTRVVTDSRDWYGEAEYLSALYHAYAELQRAQYTTENYASDFTGKVFFETFSGSGSDMLRDPAAGTGLTFWGKVKKFFTNKGKHKRSVLHREAPIDGQKTHIHEFGRNSDHEYHEAMAGLDEKKVIMAHSWHPALLGVPMAGALGQNQVFRDAFQQKYYQVVKPWQDLQMQALNTALKLFSEISQTGEDWVKGYSISLKNMYVDMLKESATDQGGQPKNEIGDAAAQEKTLTDEDIDNA